jgi:chemotaxis protein CheX
MVNIQTAYSKDGELHMSEMIVAIDCSSDVVDLLTQLLGEKLGLRKEHYESIQDIQNYRMIVLECGKNQQDLLQKIRKLRYACCFRNLPIILFIDQGNNASMEPYLTSGVTEVLALDDPPFACQQILKGYLTPNRKPIKEEMEYLVSFIKNTCDVLKTTASVNAVFREVYFANDFRIFGDISGLIGLSGTAEGTLGITFYWPLAQKIIAQMMGVTENRINADLIHDGVAEIINMISGSTKKEFVGKPYHFEISLPSVVVGSGHQIGHSENTPVAVLIFEVSGECFALQVCLSSRKRKR